VRKLTKTGWFGVLAFAMSATACASGGRGAGIGDGAVTAPLAVDAFLASAKNRDLAAMSRVWGTANGPAGLSMERGALEKRELIIQCHLQHDVAKVVSDYAGEGGRRIFRVDLTKGGVRKTTSVTTVPGPEGRWYVESADIEKTAEFCRGGLGNP
jgi:hypothetical protein